MMRRRSILTPIVLVATVLLTTPASASRLVVAQVTSALVTVGVLQRDGTPTPGARYAFATIDGIVLPGIALLTLYNAYKEIDE